jgi:AraC family transcriptional regulator
MASLDVARASADTSVQAAIGAPAYDVARWQEAVPEVTNFVRQSGFTSFVQRTRPDGPAQMEVSVVDPPEHVLLMFRRPVSRIEITIDALRKSYDLAPRSFVSVPMGLDTIWRAPARDVDSVHHLHFEESLFRTITGVDGAPFPLLIGVSDQRLANLVEIAAGLSSDVEPPSQLSWESCAVLILHQLLRVGSANTGVVIRRGGLAGWQVRRTTEFIHANLAANIGLQQLADIAGLSAFHFARAFKQSVGDPPHRYQTRRRIEKACELLLGSEMPIVEIATAVGYEAPQTLTRLFRREMGVTPSDYRRDIRR